MAEAFDRMTHVASFNSGVSVNLSDQRSRPVVSHAACGLFAGLVLGLLIELQFFWPNDPDLDPKHFILRFGRVRLPLIGPAISCAACAVLAAIAGGVEIRGLPKSLLVGMLIGVVVVGLIIGGFVFPSVATALTTTPFQSKYYAGYQLAGMSVGIPAGALLGLVAGMGYHFCFRRPERTRLQVVSRQPECR